LFRCAEVEHVDYNGMTVQRLKIAVERRILAALCVMLYMSMQSSHEPYRHSYVGVPC